MKQHASHISRSAHVVVSPVNDLGHFRYNDQFAKDLIDLLPELNRRAYRLTGHRENAEDLVQTTCLLVVQHKHLFTPGTNFGAWVYRIMRNKFMTDVRSKFHKAQHVDIDDYANMLAVQPDTSGIAWDDFKRLTTDVRGPALTALALVGYEGMDYQGTADLLGIKLGTLKSLVSRARSKLKE